jgi:hypothetical protein
MIARAHRTESALIASGNYSSPGKTEPLANKGYGPAAAGADETSIALTLDPADPLMSLELM